MRTSKLHLALAGALFTGGVAAAVATGGPGAAKEVGGGAAVVSLDEDFAIRVSRAFRPSQVGRDTVRIRTAAGAEARGVVVAGAFLTDRAESRRVVVRPEAVQEYFQIVRGFDRADATRAAAKTLRALETTGRLGPIDKIETALRGALGPSSGAGVRLDDPMVFGTIPPHGDHPGAMGQLRRLVAGDDAKWDAYLSVPDMGAFVELVENPDYERFHHAVDPVTGTQDTQSVFRRREHRRVVLRRSTSTITFVPDVPTRTDLSDTGYVPASVYDVSVRSPLGAGRTLMTAEGESPVRFVQRVVSLTTLGWDAPFASPDNAPAVRVSGPRVVTVTPPNGEIAVDPSTEWEDPDNIYATPVPARRTFTVRLRFAYPIHPADVTQGNFTLTRTARNVGTRSETPVNERMNAGVFLAQRRLGEVLVEITPQVPLDPSSRFEVRMSSAVRNLSGEPAVSNFVSEFTTY